MEKLSSIDNIRKQIDALDDQLIAILNERTSYVKEIGNLKQKSGSRIYRPEREQAIVDRLHTLSSKGPLSRAAIESIMLEIFAVSRNFELPSTISYLGPEGSFTHQAAASRFGGTTTYKPLKSIRSVIESVDTRRVDYGVVPIENNSQGMVGETIDFLAKFDVHITGEVPMGIHFCFASACDSLSKITKIYSKDVAFNQCRDFIEDYLDASKIEIIPVNSTSKAAQLAKDDPTAGAICSHIAARLLQLPIFYENIEDSDGNTTRFLILSKEAYNNKGKENKTTILTRLTNDSAPGSLFRFLKDFNDEDINIIKLTSHPAREGNKFKYWFFLEFDGHKDDEKVKRVLDKNKEHVRVIGSYLKAV